MIELCYSFFMSIEVQRILKEVQSEFKECVDARAIAKKARMEKIIPEAVETQINRSTSLDAAKEVLFEHLQHQVTLEGLRRFCSIMEESEGYLKMQRFGKELQAKLEEVRRDCTNWFRLCPDFQPPAQPGQLWNSTSSNITSYYFLLFSRTASLKIIMLCKVWHHKGKFKTLCV